MLECCAISNFSGSICVNNYLFLKNLLKFNLCQKLKDNTTIGCAFFVVVMMYVIMHDRSGAALAVMDLIVIEKWSGFLYQIIFVFCLFVFCFQVFFHIFSQRFANIPYSLLVKLTITLATILVFLFTGLIGLLVLLIASFIGLLPVEWGIRRSHCMGILLIPVILYYF